MDTLEEAEFNTTACSALKKLKDLRCSFRGKKVQQARESLKDLAYNLPDTHDVCEFLQSSTMSKAFDQCCLELTKSPKCSFYNHMHLNGACGKQWADNPPGMMSDKERGGKLYISHQPSCRSHTQIKFIKT